MRVPIRVSTDIASIEPEFSVPSPLLVQWRSPVPSTRARRNYSVKIQVACDESAFAPAAYLNGVAAPFADVIAPWLLIQSRQAAADAPQEKRGLPASIKASVFPTKS